MVIAAARALETMERIIRVAEAQIPPRNPDDFDSSEESIAEIIGHLTHSASKEFYDFDTKKEEITNVKILVLTRSGLSARMVSKYRPLLPIIAVTSQETTAREMRLIWGVEPLMIQGIDDEWNTFVKIQKSVRVAVDRNMLEPTDKIITVGNMNYLPARTNMISIFKVSDIIASEGK